MANAWIVPPLPAVAAVTGGTVQLGTGSNVMTDFAGVVVQVACNSSANGAFIHFDLGADTAFDTMMIFGVELVPADTIFGFSYATQAQGDFTGAFGTVYGSTYAGSAPMTSGKGVSIWSAAGPLTARYIQIFYQATSAGKSVRISRFVLGKRVQLARNFGMGGSFGVRDLGSLDFSPRGVLMRRRGRKLRTASLTFSNVYKDEVEAQTKPLLEQIGNTEMVALVTDPAADAQRQNRCYYGALVGDLGHTQRNARAWEAKVNMVSIF